MKTVKDQSDRLVFKVILTNWLKLILNLVNNLTPLVLSQLKTLHPEGHTNSKDFSWKHLNFSNCKYFDLVNRNTSKLIFGQSKSWEVSIVWRGTEIIGPRDSYWASLFFFRLKFNKDTKINPRFQKISHHCLVNPFKDGGWRGQTLPTSFSTVTSTNVGIRPPKTFWLLFLTLCHTVVKFQWHN